MRGNQYMVILRIILPYDASGNQYCLKKFRRLRRDYSDSAEVLSIRRPVLIIGTNKVRDKIGMVFTIQNMDV